MSGGAAVIESTAPNLEATLQNAELQLLRRFYKSLTTMAETWLRKLRLRHAASRVLQAKQKRVLLTADLGEMLIKVRLMWGFVFPVVQVPFGQALEEAESACASPGSFSKLDVADLLMGAEPAEFSTPLITDVFPKLLELKCYRAGAGQLSRTQWMAAISAFENEKLISVKVFWLLVFF